VWCLRIHLKTPNNAVAELELKIPLDPLLQRGNYLGRALTPLWKRGEGEIFKPNEL
jgi:hypothetical protein